MLTLKACDVLVIGGTGYLGRPLIAALLERGHRVRALGRPTSIVPGASPVIGDPLDVDSLMRSLRPGDTLVQLMGTSPVAPRRATECLSVDLASVRASIAAAERAGVSHFVYVSVAQPAPLTGAYVAARTEGEVAISEAGLTATILRPWYVIGPGHRWPMALIPIYAIASLVPVWHSSANRLGLVTLRQMVAALTSAVENPPERGFQRILAVPAIRNP